MVCVFNFVGCGVSLVILLALVELLECAAVGVEDYVSEPLAIWKCSIDCGSRVLSAFGIGRNGHPALNAVVPAVGNGIG